MIGSRVTSLMASVAAWLADLPSRLFPGLFSKTAVVVEPASLRDAPRLAQLHRASFHRGWGADEFEQILIERNTLAHRLRSGNSTIGFIVSRIAADEAEILSVAVASKYRGKGHSRDLLRTHLGHLAGYGLKTVFLEVEENNRPARSLYKRAGFSVVGRRERYYKDAGGEQLNAVVMRRDLS
jgi:ribosomal-protein-alanine N-acetyltransferase